MVENRETPRHKTLKAGLIAFNDKRSTVSCTISNLSESGARLKVASVVGIPDQFDLQMSDKSVRACTVIWRKTNEIGIAFDAGTNG